MVLTIGFTVLARFFFNYAGAWSVELSEYIMLYATFLAAPWLVRQGEHIKLDLLTNALSEKNQYYFKMFAYIVSLLVCIIVAYFGFIVAWDNYVREVTLINIFSLPKYILLVIIPISGLFMLLEFLNRIIQEY